MVLLVAPANISSIECVLIFPNTVCPTQQVSISPLDSKYKLVQGAAQKWLDCLSKKNLRLGSMIAMSQAVWIGFGFKTIRQRGLKELAGHDIFYRMIV